MPRRTDSHVISDLALNRVMQICGECGWACEVVHKDYGEDILVQTHYKTILDHYRIWIQVKGTRNLKRFYTKQHGYSLTIPTHQMLKWVRNKEITIVILWDVEKDFGLWSIPKHCSNDWDIYNAQAGKSRLSFQETSLFNAEQALSLSWMARIDHYTDLIDQAIQREKEYLQLARDDNDSDKKSRIPLLASDFLRMLGILNGEYLSDEFVVAYHKELERVGKSFPKDEAELAVAIYLFTGELEQVSPGCSVSISLLVACSTLIIFCIQHGNQAHLHVSNLESWTT